MPATPDSVLARLEGLGIQLDLERPRRLLAALGNPQDRVPAVVVAGTNGKGSTATFLAAMARAAGYRVGLYTSPHLERIEERLRIDGRSISSERLAALLEEILRIAEAQRLDLPTYFEALTHAAFLWFAEEALDLAVLEVGLGGRLDATNLCQPILSLITSIALDHQEYLGDSLAAIAREKAGILRRGRPALAGMMAEGEAAAALRAAAEALGAELAFVPRETTIAVRGAGAPGGSRLELQTLGDRYDLRPLLPGAHQGHNLALAVRAAEVLGTLGFPRLDRAAIERGAASARWPGRLEWVRPPGQSDILLDAAHNADGARALAGYLDECGRPATVLFGVLADKDPRAMLEHLAPHARGFVLTRPASPRALDPKLLVPLLPSGIPYLVEPDLERALTLALAQSQGLVVACGSLFLLGTIRASLHRRFGVPEPAVTTALF